MFRSKGLDRRKVRVVLATLLVLPLVAGPLGASPDKSFLFVASGPSQLFEFEIDSATGALNPLAGAALPPGFFPQAVAATTTGPFVYAVASFPNAVAAFGVNPATGAMSPVAGSPFLTSGATAVDAVVGGLGRFLYVANNVSEDVAAYRIDASGALSPVPGQPFAVGILGRGALAQDPAGKFLYVATGAITASLSVFRIDPATGSLSHVPGSPFAADAGPNVVAVDPSGRFLYVANEQTERISAFAVDAASGGLAPIPGSPFPASPRPLSLAVDALGKRLFVGQAFDVVSAFSIETTSGRLDLVPGSPFPSGHQPNALLVDSTSAFVYVTDPGQPLPPPMGQGAVWVHAIDTATGELTTVGQFAAGPMPWALAGLAPASTNRPPDCAAARPSVATIWPPNHKLVNVKVLGVADPEGQQVTVTITSIRQDEPVDCTSDGDFSPDAFGLGTATAMLRADRLGTGNGRVYHLGFRAQDANGATCTGVVRVSVPHDRAHDAVDDASQYDSTTP
jgi:6-phosphogluconolactonase (cycloisomerase 2 family)